MPNVLVGFGKPCGTLAKMSMVHVENCALAHILTALHCRTVSIVNIVDCNINIVSLYRRLAGKAPPPVALPFWVLKILVATATLCHIVVKLLTGFEVLHPMIGPNDGALSSGSEFTLDGRYASKALGYEPIITIDTACRKIRGTEVSKRVREAQSRCR